MEEKEFLEWKDKYWNLYYVEIEDEEFLFRELSRAEYKKGKRLFDETDVASFEEYVCKTCVLEPADFDFENCIAGIPTSLAEFILVESGFTEDISKLVSYLAAYRSEMETFDNQVSCIIKEAFPDKDIEEIENWPMQKTMWYYSRAEYVLGELRGIPLEITPLSEDNSQQNKVQQAVQQPAEQPAKQAERPKPTGKEGVDYKIEMDGSKTDFPEVGEIEAFMKGKWMPPPRMDGEELL